MALRSDVMSHSLMCCYLCKRKKRRHQPVLLVGLAHKAFWMLLGVGSPYKCPHSLVVVNLFSTYNEFNETKVHYQRAGMWLTHTHPSTES